MSGTNPLPRGPTDLDRFLQTDPVGYEEDLNLYAYVRNDPLNSSDPTGRQTFAVGVEEEVVLLTGQPQSPSHGAGLFGNVTGDRITVGSYETTREAWGQDTSASVVGSVTFGDVENDFAGDSLTGEADLSAFGANVTGEAGTTSSGKLTFSAEFGPGTPGGSFGQTHTEITSSVTVDVGDELSRASSGAQDLARQVQEFLRDPVGSLGIGPSNGREELN